MHRCVRKGLADLKHDWHLREKAQKITKFIGLHLFIGDEKPAVFLNKDHSQKTNLQVSAWQNSGIKVFTTDYRFTRSASLFGDHH